MSADCPICQGTGFRLEDGRAIGVVQIAGLVARRIVCDVSRGDTLERGQRFVS